MKFQIKHECRGRIRVQAMQQRMTLEQADMLEAWLLTLPQVERASVHERTRCAVIEYQGDRQDLLRALAGFSYQNHALAELVPLHSSRALNRAYEEKLVVYGGYTMEGGHEAMNTLLDRNPELTGVFVSNYEMTVGAMLALNERGLQIPRELSLIGFDNFELARVVKPRLTIAEQPIEEIGRKAAQLLLEQLQEKKPPRRVVLDARLRLGDSVRRIL